MDKEVLKSEDIPLTAIEELQIANPQELVAKAKAKTKKKKDKQSASSSLSSSSLSSPSPKPKVASKERSKLDRASKADIDRLVTACLAQGITVRYHNHPRTRAKWGDKLMKVTVIKKGE
jgi:hypothetical protein